MTAQSINEITPTSDGATVGDLMSPPIGVFRGDQTVAETVEQLRTMTQEGVVTYCYITDESGGLEGWDAALAAASGARAAYHLNRMLAIEDAASLAATAST